MAWGGFVCEGSRSGSSWCGVASCVRDHDRVAHGVGWLRTDHRTPLPRVQGNVTALATEMAVCSHTLCQHCRSCVMALSCCPGSGRSPVGRGSGRCPAGRGSGRCPAGRGSGRCPVGRGSRSCPARRQRPHRATCR